MDAKTCQPHRLKINACFSVSSSRTTELRIYPFSDLELQSNDAVKKSKHTKRKYSHSALQKIMSMTRRLVVKWHKVLKSVLKIMKTNCISL